MSLELGFEDLREYLKHLKVSTTETEYLHSSILIGVTEFFRDWEAFMELQSQFYEKLTEDDNPQMLRIWSAACSTGQEAFKENLLEEFKRTVENVVGVVFKLKRRADGNYVYVFNDGAIGEKLGITTKKVAGKSLMEVVGKDEAEKLTQIYDRAFFGELVETEFEFSGRWYYSRITPDVKDGKTTGVIGSAIDITEKKILESKLIQSQKLETIGSLASGIAHDFNNMLQPILVYSKILKMDFEKDQVPDSPKSLEKLNRILSAVDKAKNLVSQILDFARKSEVIEDYGIQTEIFDSVRDNLNLLLLDLPPNIKVNIQIENNTQAYVQVDSTRVTQILINLINNAIHAMKGIPNSSLTIRLRRVKGLPEDWKTENDSKLEFPGILLSIRDTGHGISMDKITRIFDPFYSGKRAGEGVGLGLSIVYGLVNRANGSLDLRSEVGKFTEFRIFLPEIKNPRKESRESNS